MTSTLLDWKRKHGITAEALAKEAIDKLIPQKSAMKTVVFGFLPNARYDRHMFKGDAAAITIKVCVKGLPDNHQFALGEFKESFYNPNKQMLESNFAVSTSIVHDRSFILYKNMRGESCKHIG